MTDQNQAVPYARFKDVNDKRAAAESALAALQAKYDQDVADLRGQLEAASGGNDGGDSGLQARFDALQAEHSDLLGKVRQFERAAAVQRVAAEFQIPAPVAERLRGDSEAELRADAKALLEKMPRTPAPKIDADAKPAGEARLSLELMQQPDYYAANRRAIFGAVKSGARITE